MTRTFGWKGLVAVAAALVFVAAASTSAMAERGRRGPGEGRPVMSFAGKISAIEATEDGTLLTLDRARMDDVQVLVTDETKIQPPDATPEIGNVARAVVESPSSEGDIPVVKVLVLAKGARLPVGPAKPRSIRICGTISSLPADVHDGTWVLSVPNDADYDVIVNAATVIAPEGATPAVGGRACVVAERTDDGLVAKQIRLSAAELGPVRRERKMVAIRGVVADPLPEDRTGDWTLVVTVDNGDTVQVQVSVQTEIEGELAVGVRVVVQAEVATDAAGNETLQARKIVVAEGTGREPRQPKPVVRFEGTVTAADAASWTIETEDEVLVVLIDADTAVVGLPAGESPVGREVVGTASRAEDGTLTAKVLRIKRD